MVREGSQPNDHGVGGRTSTSDSTGTLYVVSTPIGHPDDITLRALATLRSVTIIASEDPRATQALLAHHGITATVTSYGPFIATRKCCSFCIDSRRDRMSPSSQTTAPLSSTTQAVCLWRLPIEQESRSRPSQVLLLLRLRRRSLAFPVMPSSLRDTFPQPAVVSHNISPNSAMNQAPSSSMEPQVTIQAAEILTQILPTRQIAITMDLTTCKETLFAGSAE